MMTVEEYRADLHNQIAIDAKSDKEKFPKDEFLAKITSMLSDADEFDDFNECYYEDENSRGWKIAINGYAFDEVDDSCCLFICDYRGPETDDDAIRQDDITLAFNKVKRFVQESIKNKLYANLEESTEVYEFSKMLYESFDKISKFRFFLLTDAYNKQRVKNLKDESIEGKIVELNVWDIIRIYDLQKDPKEPVEVIVEEYGYKGIPCVKAVEYNDVRADIEIGVKIEGADEKPQNIITYSSYLAVVPGKILNDLYMDYGSRLLEGNVRSFLSAKGKVNAGIQRTIKHYPEMFFAYNNGIAATATEIDTEMTRNGLIIKRIKDLQIVNGGQTTASIANTLRTARSNEIVKIDRLYVPMKISVLEHSMSEKLIPKISEYSNSQNKVDAAAFFSNHPFNVRMKDLSERITAPAIHGNQFGQHWFYERLQGEYKQNMILKTKGEINKFQLEYPANQVIKLADLAKYMVIYEGRPDIVSRGKLAIIKSFAAEIKEIWGDKTDTNFNDVYYKRVVALAIIFKDTDQIIKDKLWYKERHSYKANVIAYTMSIIFDEIRRHHKDYTLDFMRIWNEQEVYKELKSQISILCDEVYDFITSENREIADVMEWCKKEGCWQRAQAAKWTLEKKFFDTLVSIDEKKAEDKGAKKIQGVDNDSNYARQVLVIHGSQYWKYWGKVLEWAKHNYKLSENEERVLNKVVDQRQYNRLSRGDYKDIVDIRQKLIDNGMPLEFD